MVNTTKSYSLKLCTEKRHNSNLIIIIINNIISEQLITEEVKMVGQYVLAISYAFSPAWWVKGV